MFINNNFRFCYLCISKYYPQTFLEERKYVMENIKTKNCIDEELRWESESDSDSDSDYDSDIDTGNEE